MPDAGVSGGVTSANVAWPTGITVTLPSSSSGDTLVLFAFRDQYGGGSFNVPSGWTYYADISGAETSGRDRVSMVCTKTSSGAEPSSIVVSGTGNSRWLSGVIVRYSSADGLDVTPTTSHRIDGTSDNTPPNAAITTATSDAMVVTVMGLNAGNAVSAWGAPAGYTLVDSVTGSAAIGVAEKTVASAGLESPGSWTNTPSGSTGDYLGATIAIKHSAGGSTYTLTAEAGTLTYTGVEASLEHNRVLPADAGAITYSGVDASLLRGYPLAADAGSISYNGTDASLLYSQVLGADAGSLTYTGVDASLLYGHSLTSDAGAITYAGVDATLTYNPAGSYTLTADAGSIAYNGTDASLLQNRVVTAEAGNYVLSGIDALLLRGYPIAADAGAITYTGADANFFLGRSLTAEPGTFTMTGVDAVLDYSGEALWTVQTSVATAWASQADSSDTWTEIPNNSTTWTKQ